MLVEGYWSAIRLHVLGIPVAALMGWSVSPEQVALLRERGIRFVTLLLDGNDTGRRGREAVLPDLAAAFFVRAPCYRTVKNPTRCRNSSCASSLTLITNPRVKDVASFSPIPRFRWAASGYYVMFLTLGLVIRGLARTIETADLSTDAQGSYHRFHSRRVGMPVGN